MTEFIEMSNFELQTTEGGKGGGWVWTAVEVGCELITGKSPTTLVRDAFKFAGEALKEANIQPGGLRDTVKYGW